MEEEEAERRRTSGGEMDGCVSRKTRVKGDTEVSTDGENLRERRFVFFVKMCTGKLVIGEVESEGREEACAERGPLRERQNRE